MTIEQAAREYIRLRRLRLTMRDERFRLMKLCTETEWSNGDPWSRPTWSDCLSGWDDHADKSIEGWGHVEDECNQHSGCAYCNVAYLAHFAYRNLANKSGAALRLLERKINSATA